jgi:hypothetical protein
VPPRVRLEATTGPTPRTAGYPFRALPVRSRVGRRANSWHRNMLLAPAPRPQQRGTSAPALPGRSARRRLDAAAGSRCQSRASVPVVEPRCCNRADCGLDHYGCTSVSHSPVIAAGPPRVNRRTVVSRLRQGRDASLPVSSPSRAAARGHTPDAGRPHRPRRPRPPGPRSGCRAQRGACGSSPARASHRRGAGRRPPG